jgi:hypothetical protein
MTSQVDDFMLNLVMRYLCKMGCDLPYKDWKVGNEEEEGSEK